MTDLEAEREAIRQRSPLTHIQQEKKDSPAMAHILIRGEYDRPGETVEAATPAALHPLPDDAARNPVVAGGTLYLVTANGQLHAFR